MEAPSSAPSGPASSAPDISLPTAGNMPGSVPGTSPTRCPPRCQRRCPRTPFPVTCPVVVRRRATAEAADWSRPFHYRCRSSGIGNGNARVGGSGVVREGRGRGGAGRRRWARGALVAVTVRVGWCRGLRNIRTETSGKARRAAPGGDVRMAGYPVHGLCEPSPKALGGNGSDRGNGHDLDALSGTWSPMGSPGPDDARPRRAAHRLVP